MLLNCHTYYSFCYGTLSIDHLLSAVQLYGYSSFALTDINNTSACLETVRRAEAKGLKPVMGIDFRNSAKQKYVGIAKNNNGFRELNAHLSEYLHSGKEFEERAPEFQDAFIIYPLSSYKGWTLCENEFIGISIKDLSTLPFLPAKNHSSKWVALQSATFLTKKQHSAHRLLRAIDKNALLSKLSPSEQAPLTDSLLPRIEMEKAYASFPSILPNTQRLLDQCGIHFEYGKLANKNLRFYTKDGAGDMQLLRAECERNLLYRYPNPSQEVLQRVEKELEVISKMNFASYFLINWDIVSYAQRQKYYYVGRGSGANSIVAYLLRITDVDPIELDLYFERFINLYRNNAPDFDIDFSWTDRDDITHYIFERFNKDNNVALLGAYNTFQESAVVRELGKVFGLPPGEIDKLQTSGPGPENDEYGKIIFNYAKVIHGFPSHLSVHSSGIIISQESIHCYSATNLPPKGYATTQFSMLEAEDIGLYKFDILSQRGLGKIKDALGIIKKNKGVEIDIHQMNEFKNDEQVKALLREGKAIGCFYVESPAMRMLLAKLRADDYLRLVAASSIIRPGVAKSGMMREYILRFRDERLRMKAREQLPELYDILEETYGVMVYQEDVIKVAHLFAGLTLAEADYLRRGMSWKFKQRNEFFLVKQNFFKNCREKNYDSKLIHDIWNQIESFANFAFSKGHSASYAVESYQALFLKAHYPLEYMVATLNNGGGFYRRELYVHEARMHGAGIKPPCVNVSEVLTVIRDRTIYLGLGLIAELTQESMQAILQERRHGTFKSLDDFVKRVPVSLEQVRLLIRAGAFHYLKKGKKELLWDVHALLNAAPRVREAELFGVQRRTWELPELTEIELDEAFDQMELLGFPLRSPFDLLRDPVPSAMKARELKNHIGKTVSIAGYLVTIKYASTSTQQQMYFGTFIDRDGEWIDTVHFPRAAKQYPFTGSGCYLLKGKVTEEYDFLSIEISEMKHLPVVDREAVVIHEQETRK